MSIRCEIVTLLSSQRLFLVLKNADGMSYGEVPFLWRVDDFL